MEAHGAVHIAQALAPMAEQAGYEVVIVDPRTAFATVQRFARERLGTRCAASARMPSGWRGCATAA